MKFALAILGLAGLAVAAPEPQGVTAIMTPTGAAPAGCTSSYPGEFEITIVQPSNIQNRDLAERQQSCGQTGVLTLTLQNGQLHDMDGRTGYIAGNNSQFQFDKPIQAGAEYTAGFTVCKNGSIALGPTTTFYQCLSGNIRNLYYADTADQCTPINIDIIPCSGSGSTGGSSAAPASSGSSASAAPVSASSDGQPEATVKPTQVPVSVFTDGQPQATNAPTSVAPVSEFTDGQPQATANATKVVAATPTIQAAGAAQLFQVPAYLAVGAVAAALL